jgi:hypothetical protein
VPTRRAAGRGDLPPRLEAALPADAGGQVRTSFVASVDLPTGRLRYTNAGHNPALLVRAAGEIERLGSTGVPLGMLPEAPFAAKEVDLAPGDLFVAYTDGIVEACDPKDEEYGLERMEAVCRDERAKPLAEIATALDRSPRSSARSASRRRLHAGHVARERRASRTITADSRSSAASARLRAPSAAPRPGSARRRARGGEGPAAGSGAELPLGRIGREIVEPGAAWPAPGST